jgi:thiamine-phosphate pyrophosphorylase
MRGPILPGTLYVITDTSVQNRFSHVELGRLAAEAGADIVQLREKRPRTTAELVRIAQELVEAVRGKGAKVLVNDRVDVALEAGADGVHLGRDDLDPVRARKILGEPALIGRTANSLEEAVRVARLPVDYLGVGPVFGTKTKAKPAPPLGLEGLRRIVQAVDKPVVAIGNLTAERVEEVLDAGAVGIAVLSAVAADPDPARAVRVFREAIEAWRRRTSSGAGRSRAL